MGAVKQARLNPNCLPTKFECQAYKKPVESDSTQFETLALESNEVEKMHMSTSDLFMDTASYKGKNFKNI